MRFGRFEVLETIGRGATSVVYKGQDTLLGRNVALKVLRTDLTDEKWAHLLFEEARLISQLRHPYIVALFDLGLEESEGNLYLVMEFVPGNSLDELLRKRRPEPEKTCRWLAQISRALAYAHRRGITHRDIKPANIVISDDGQALLTDFGIAKNGSILEADIEGLLGTPSYMAPEQIEGEHVGPASDFFALGAVLFHALTGIRPFSGDSLTEVCTNILSSDAPSLLWHRPDLPLGLDAVVRRCLSKRPVDRFKDGEELAAALEGAASEIRCDKALQDTALLLPGTSGQKVFDIQRNAMDATLIRGAVPPTRRNRIAAVAVFAASCLLFGGSVMTSVSGARPSVEEPTMAPPTAPARKIQSSTSVVAAATPKPSPAIELSVPRLSSTAYLKIQVTSKKRPDIVAVLSGETVVWSVHLNELKDESARVFRTLSIGNQQMRVAVYGEDGGLRTEKISLVRLRPGRQNEVAIHVVDRPFGRAPGLRVFWLNSIHSNATNGSDLVPQPRKAAAG
ncbi:MAG: serine/threonine protein kinase [Acidobacteria bacterium]|nr:serine/threonine protein kinase [Acidobacteriota bacterium]